MTHEYKRFIVSMESARARDRVEVLQSVVCVTEYMTDADQIKACLKGFLSNYIRQQDEIMMSERDDDNGNP